MACWFWRAGTWQPLLRTGSCSGVHCSRRIPASGSRGSTSITPAASASSPPPAASSKLCSCRTRHHRSSPPCMSSSETRRCCPASSPLARGSRRRPEVRVPGRRRAAPNGACARAASSCLCSYSGIPCCNATINWHLDGRAPFYSVPACTCLNRRRLHHCQDCGWRRRV